MSEEKIPGPLVPKEVDLRDFRYMPLDVVRLRDSDLAATSNGEVFRAAVLSWCVSWHQTPAASLPDDDAILARLLGYGRDVSGWVGVRKMGALRGFVRCSDGRLYHPVVAEKAIEAWEAKKRQRLRTQKARDKALEIHKTTKQSQNQLQKHDRTSDTSVTSDKNQTKGRDRDRDREGNKESPPTPSLRMTEDGAKAVVNHFLKERERLWPEESKFPAPTLTLREQAKNFIAAGASPDLICEVVTRVAEKNKSEKQRAPHDLRFCSYTVERAVIAGKATAIAAGGSLKVILTDNLQAKIREDRIREEHGMSPLHGDPGWWKERSYN